MNLADGGAIADWSLAADILVAVGTVGATVVALYATVRALSQARRESRDARWTAARKVFITVEAAPNTRPSVTVVNASTGPITNVVVVVECHGTDPEGTWKFDTTSERATLPYLLAGEGRSWVGDIWPRGEANASLESWRFLDRLVTRLGWSDEQGTYWARIGGGDAFPSSRGYIGRDIRKLVTPPRRWPRLGPLSPRVRREDWIP